MYDCLLISYAPVGMSVCFFEQMNYLFILYLGNSHVPLASVFLCTSGCMCVFDCVRKGQSQPSSFTALQVTLITLSLRNVPAIFFPLSWWCFKMWISESADRTDRKRSDGQYEAARVSGAHVEAMTAHLWLRFMGEPMIAMPFSPCNYNTVTLFPNFFQQWI